MHEPRTKLRQRKLNSSVNPTIDTNTNRFSINQGFAYDKNGNVGSNVDPITSLNRTFLFNGDNKQTVVKDANSNVIGRYFYDGEGKRVKKITNSETTIFVYSNGKLVAEYSTLTSSTPSISYTTSNHLGSPRVITDSIGQVSSRRDFLPFGEDVLAGVGSRTSANRYSSTTDSIRQKFTGYQKDTETSLDFAEARMYDNRFGRFTAVDPLLASGKSADPQTFNRFVYVGNSPLAITDPTGLDWYRRRRLGDDSGRSDYDWFDKDPGGAWEAVPFRSTEAYFQVDNWRIGDGPNQGTVYLNKYSDSVLTQQEHGNLMSIAMAIQSAVGPIDDNFVGQLKAIPNIGIELANACIAGYYATKGNVLPQFAPRFPRIPYSNLGQSVSGYGTEFVAPTLATAGVSAAAKATSGSTVLVDSSVTTRLASNPSLGGAIANGETPLISYVTRPELRNAVSNGSLRGVPKALDDVAVLSSRPSLNLRINIRGMLKDSRGGFGDGIIGAQALENNLILASADKNLIGVVRSLGGRCIQF